MLHFNGPVVRPPQEDYRQFIEVTVGCTHNSCRFCNFYRDFPFRMAPLEQVESDIGESFADIAAAILHLENNYIGEISVAELARLCGMCESRFRSRFLEYAGMPPVRYRNYLRAKKAAELLSGGGCTVAEAAELVGIPDVAYFSRVFKQFCGKNPGEVRKS